MFDVAIIGTGAAGVSAALTLQALKKNFIWFGSRNLSGKIGKAEKILNYPGLPAVSGAEMREAFLRQIDDMGITITEKTVTGVYLMGDYYGILCNQEMFEAKTVILGTGVEAVKPVKGELELIGRGVSYCATCDGFLYKGKTIAIVCTAKEYEHEIEYLASLAAKVYVRALYQDVDIKADNVEFLSGAVTEIRGSKKAEALVTTAGEVAVDGVFMLKSAVTPSVLVSGLEAESGHVSVNRACETNLPGCFAAGDCTGRPYQYTKAVGEGNIAAHSAVAFLSKK
ncbi:MAG: NAD(P)/FAD-dependent oxidoreductase [Christensenellaceae bacterium]